MNGYLCLNIYLSYFVIIVSSLIFFSFPLIPFLLFIMSFYKARRNISLLTLFFTLRATKAADHLKFFFTNLNHFMSILKAFLGSKLLKSIQKPSKIDTLLLTLPAVFLGNTIYLALLLDCSFMEGYFPLIFKTERERYIKAC